MGCYTRNATYDAYLVVEHTSRTEIIDVDAFAETKKTNQASRLRNVTATETMRTEINGHPAHVSEITGQLPANGMRYTFIQTLIDNGSDLFLLVVWTPADVLKGALREQFDGMAQRLTGI